MTRSKRILKIITNNLTLFPGKISVTGIFYTLIMVLHNTLWNQATTDIANFDIIQSIIVTYANTMYENQKALTYQNHPLKCILTLQKFPKLVPHPFFSNLRNVDIPQITQESFNVSCFSWNKVHWQYLVLDMSRSITFIANNTLLYHFY